MKEQIDYIFIKDRTYEIFFFFITVYLLYLKWYNQSKQHHDAWDSTSLKVLTQACTSMCVLMCRFSGILCLFVDPWDDSWNIMFNKWLQNIVNKVLRIDVYPFRNGADIFLTVVAYSSPSYKS